MDRLCVHSMLPRRHGGIGEGYSKIMAIDAGNCSDVYQIVNFARQYGLETKRVLQNLLISRVFTIYQLTHLVTDELPKIIGKISSNANLIVVYGLLHLFVSDPHIDKKDAKQLIKETAHMITKVSEDRFMIVSFDHCHKKYERFLIPAFDNTIGLSNETQNDRMVRVATVEYRSGERKQVSLK